MAIKKVKLPNNTVVDINDARIPGVDSTPTSGSTNVVTSGGVQAALTNGSVTKVGTATVGASNRPIYLNAGVPTVTEPGEAFLSWGGRGINGNLTPVGMSLSAEHSANRTAYINGDLITAEYSSNGGSSWTAYSATASAKSMLFTKSYDFPIGRPNSSTDVVANQSKTRITLTAQDNTNPSGRVYTAIKKMLVNVSSATALQLLVELRTGANYINNGAWSTFGTYTVSGWSGWSDIPLVTTLGGDTSQTSQYWQLRLTFTVTSVSSSYPKTASVIGVRIFGQTDWYTPSNMAATGHLYSYDESQNATFPAKVTATQFVKSGGTSSQFLKADGSVDSNTYVKTSQLPAAPGTLNTTATTAQSTSSSEALSGNVTLHKVAKTGTYSDLIGKPTIPSAPGTLNTTATAAQSTSSSEALSGNVTLHKVSKTGSYDDLNSKPSFPAAVYYDPATEMLYFFKSAADKDSFVANKTQTSLILFSTETSPYIKFKDSAIANICATNWGDGTGITEMRASKSLSMLNAFKDNTNITSFDELRYFTGVTSLENAFQNSSLTKVTLPSGLVIGNSSSWLNIFNGCASLKEIDLSDIRRDENNSVGLARQYSLFLGCSSLTILRFSSLEQINNICRHYFAAQAPSLDCPFCANNDEHYVYINGDELRDLVIPSTMTEITSCAFYRFNRLLSVTFPQTLTKIGCFAFAGCNSLTKVVVPATNIQDRAFLDCINLEELTFTGNITGWSGECCSGCDNLKKLIFTSITTIPNSQYFIRSSMTLDYLEFGENITSIGTWFFGTTVRITKFVCRATTPPTTGSNRIFYNRPTKTYVPYSSDHSILNAYKSATNWSSWASYIFELNSDGSVPE